MRTKLDRLRHAVLYEIVGLLLSIPLVAWGFETDLMKTGVLGIGLAAWAMLWNMLYNHFFDMALIKRGRNPACRSPRLRAVHALLFEGGFVIFSVPAIAWWLSMPISKAFVMDISLMLFYLAFTYVYNVFYDRIFPYPELLPK